MRKLSLLLFGVLFSLNINAQLSTISLKPDSSIGEDAYLWKLDNDCIPYNFPGTPGDINYGNEQELPLNAWTWSAISCSAGKQRSVIRFTELNTLPANAVIVSAQLILKTPSAANTWMGNSRYPGSPQTLSNPGWIKLIKAGSTYAWNEQTITWNNFIPLNPENTNIAAVPVPASSSQYNWTASMDVTLMVIQLMSDLNTYGPTGNNGFILELQTEDFYRGLMFASSDNPQAQSRPELIITFESCDPSFSYTVQSDNPGTYSFIANSQGSAHKWMINGVIMGTDSVLNYQLTAAGNYQVCLDLGTKEEPCIQCIDLCIGEPSSISNHPSNTGKLRISPNPTKTGWNIQLNYNSKVDAVITISDAMGRNVQAFSRKINPGSNSFYIDAHSLSAGIYFLSIKGVNGLNFNEKLIKE